MAAKSSRFLVPALSPSVNCCGKKKEWKKVKEGKGMAGKGRKTDQGI